MFEVLLQPARRLSQRLSFRRKFLLIFLLSVGPGIWILSGSLRDGYRAVVRDEVERQGAVYLQDFTPLAKALAVHRGASTALLNGDSSLEASIAEAVATIDQSLQKIASERELPHIHIGQWKSQREAIVTAWQAIRSGWRSKPVEVNFAEHSRLISLVNEYRHHVAGDTGLLLDPEADAYYMIVTMIDTLPRLRERLGQTRGWTATLVKSVDPKTIGRLDMLVNGEILSLIEHIDNDLVLLSDTNPSSGAKMVAQWQPVREGIQALRAEMGGQLQSGDWQNAAGYFKKISELISWR
ncbi:hypothetical protein [Chitinimonas lacunae]|uniref:Nitrate/nitrite sensing protein domain-containing protein n=1 Tax=Chitinimonas lacunae TaxID=1963018 RepID=A0ABV8MNG1_9NEIS